MAADLEVLETPPVVKEIREKYSRMQQLALELAKGLSELAGGIKDSPLIGAYSYEANRRLEEFMHRVTDVCVVLQQRSPENVDAVIQKAVSEGKVQINATDKTPVSIEQA
jgi:hypothetical protein